MNLTLRKHADALAAEAASTFDLSHIVNFWLWEAPEDERLRTLRRDELEAWERELLDLEASGKFAPAAAQRGLA